MKNAIVAISVLLAAMSLQASGTYGRIHIVPPEIASNILQTITAEAFDDDYSETAQTNAVGRTYGEIVNTYYVKTERDVGDRNTDAAINKIVTDFSCGGMNISKHYEAETNRNRRASVPKNDYQINDDMAMINRQQVFISGTTVTDKDTFNVFTEIDTSTETARMVIDTRSLAEMRASAAANKKYVIRWGVNDGDATDYRRCPSIPIYKKNN